jgi:hypothetical protein
MDAFLKDQQPNAKQREVLAFLTGLPAKAVQVHIIRNSGVVFAQLDA